MMQFLPFIYQFDTSSAVSAGGEALGNAARRAADASDAFARMLDGVVEKEGVRPELFDKGDGEDRSFGMWDRARSGIKGLSSEAASGRLAAVSSRMESRAAGGNGGTKSRAMDVLRSVKAGKGTGTTSLNAISDLKMSREDFVAVKDALKKAGLTNDEIEALNEKIGSEAGLSWGAFVSALTGKLESLSSSGAVSLSETEIRDLQSLFQKMGFTPQEGGKLIGQLENGKSSSVWEAVSRKLQSLPADAAIDVNASELQALASATRLSDEGSARLAALLGGQDKVSLTSGQMAAVMTTLKTEVATDLEHAVASGRELLDVVDEALGKAVDRKFVADLASDRPDNDVRNQKILAQENRRQRAQERAESSGKAADGQGHAARVLEADPNNGSAQTTAVRAALAGDAAKAKGDAKAAKADAKASAKDSGTSPEDAKAAKAEEQAKLLRQGHAEGESGKDGGSAKDKSGSESDSSKSETAKAWDALLGKVRVDNTSQVRADAAAQQTAPAESSTDSLDETVARLGKNVSSRLMNQVESGILRTMGQGRKQLTLNLEPADLGKLNVVLQVKDKEVSAVLKAETQDAGRVLSEQLSQLKAHLEQQGLKVAKLEVQTQLQGQTQGDASWQGAEQHNMTQEQRNFMERRSIMRFLRQESVAAMSPEAQSEIASAGMAHDGLYVVA
ncbi:flagellar hook-length control protein FliK [Desulfocurvus sp. DL9XJH121]